MIDTKRAALTREVQALQQRIRELEAELRRTQVLAAERRIDLDNCLHPRTKAVF